MACMWTRTEATSLPFNVAVPSLCSATSPNERTASNSGRLGNASGRGNPMTAPDSISSSAATVSPTCVTVSLSTEGSAWPGSARV